MTPFERELRELGLIEKPKLKPKPKANPPAPVDQWWKRGEECPF